MADNVPGTLGAPGTPGLIKAACIQMCSGLDRGANVADAARLIGEAAGEGAEFIVTPEMTNVVDRKPARLLADLPPEGTLEEVTSFARLAQQHRIWLLIGSLALRAPDTGAGPPRACNRSFLFAPDGTIAARYDKIHMFDVSLPGGEKWQESAVYQPGTVARLVTTPFATIGLTICYDLRFPGLYQALAGAGAEILSIPAAFTRQTGRAHWELLLRARAIECGAFVIAPAQGGKHADGRETFGHSMIINPWGEIIAQSRDDCPGIILADLDLREVKTARTRIPNLVSQQQFDLRHAPSKPPAIA